MATVKSSHPSRQDQNTDNYELEAYQSFVLSQDFHPFSSPPNIPLAKAHAKARRVCWPREKSLESLENQCPCCGLPLENKQIPICVPTKQLSFLGVCFPLYFDYIKFCFFVLCFVVVAGGWYNLYLNWIGTNCEENLGTSSIICKLSLINLINSDHESGLESFRLQCLLNNVIIVGLIIAYEAFRIYQKKLIRKYKPQNSITEFAVMLKHVPKEFTKEDIQNLIDYHLEGLGHPKTHILKIFFLNDLSQYLNYSNKKKASILNKARQGQDSTVIMDQIIDLAKKQREVEDSYADNQEVKCPTGRVVIILENSNAVDALIKHFKSKELRLAQLNRKITLKRAPEPSDILWENLNSKPIVKKFWKTLAAIVVFIGIVIGFWILFGLKKFLKDIPTGDNASPIMTEYMSVLISLIAATCVAGMNTLLGIMIRKLAKKELHKTQSKYFVSTGKRLTAVLFINMSITTILANVIHSVSASQATFWKISLSGLFFDIFFLFITNSYMSSIFNYFDLVWGYKLIKRFKAFRQGDNCKLTQIEANKLFEGHPVDMALRYANVNKTAIFTGIFAPFIPCGIFFSLLGFIICFWVDKFLLLRRYVCVNRLSKHVSQAMLDCGRWFIVAYSVGNVFIFFLPTEDGILLPQGRIRNPLFWISVSVLVLALIYKLILPMEKITSCCQKRRVKENKKFVDVQTTFPETYEEFHPIYKRRNWIMNKDRNGEEIELEDTEAATTAKEMESILSEDSQRF